MKIPYAELPYRSAFAKPSVTATVFVVHRTKGWVVGVRSRSVDTFPSMPCAAGGFLDAKWTPPAAEEVPLGMIMPKARKGERIEQTAVREVEEEIGIVIQESRLQLFHVHSDPETDPRDHVVNVCYLVELDDDEAAALQAEMDAAKAGRDDLEDAYFMTEERFASGEDAFAFNHRDLMAKAIEFHASRR